MTAAHNTFWLKGALRSGNETSGRIGRKGRTRLRNRDPLMATEKSGEDGWKDGDTNETSKNPSFRVSGSRVTDNPE